jgi:hypothetical protein
MKEEYINKERDNDHKLPSVWFIMQFVQIICKQFQCLAVLTLYCISWLSIPSSHIYIRQHLPPCVLQSLSRPQRVPAAGKSCVLCLPPVSRLQYDQHFVKQRVVSRTVDLFASSVCVTCIKCAKWTRNGDNFSVRPQLLSQKIQNKCRWVDSNLTAMIPCSHQLNK